MLKGWDNLKVIFYFFSNFYALRELKNEDQNDDVGESLDYKPSPSHEDMGTDEGNDEDATQPPLDGAGGVVKSQSGSPPLDGAGQSSQKTIMITNEYYRLAKG